jgi:anti-anti-sigma factor
LSSIEQRVRRELQVIRVRLVDVPVQIWQRANTHQETIQREFDIMRADLPEDAVPNRLHQLVRGFDARFGHASEPTMAELYAAAERGDTTIDLEFLVPSEASGASQQLEVMLNEVDDFCRAGDLLLTLATPPDLVLFRRWFLGEFIRQIDQDLDPMPWPEYAGTAVEQSGAKAEIQSRSEQHDTIRFAGDLDIATAAGLRDQLVNRRASGVSHLTLDLAGVKFMDSVGISLLVAAHNRVVEDGAEMTLILSEHLKRLMEVTGLVELLRPDFVEGQS